MQKSPPTTNDLPAEHLGRRLKNARAARGVSLPEAARETCINPAILTALESDDFAGLPAEVFTRGFIKLYAKYLGLDVEETINVYLKQSNLDPAGPVDQPYRRDVLFGTDMATPRSLFQNNPRVRIIAILLATLLFFYAVGAILKATQKHPEQSAPENELARSLMDSNTPPLPGPPGETPTVSETIGQGEGAGDPGQPPPGAEPQPAAETTGEAATGNGPQSIPDQMAPAGQPAGQTTVAAPATNNFTAAPEQAVPAQPTPGRRPARNVSSWGSPKPTQQDPVATIPPGDAPARR